MQTVELIAAKTEAVDVDFVVKTEFANFGQSYPVTLVAIGLSGDEQIVIHAKAADGSSEAASDINGAVYLAADRNVIVIPYAGSFIAKKPATVGDVSLTMYR